MSALPAQSAAPAAAVPPANPQPRPLSGDHAPGRLRLQRRAGETLQQHLRRSLVRVSVLITADFTAFYLLRALVRAVRDRAVLGFDVATVAGQLLPQGYMNGWQFGLALIISLLVFGTYSAGDPRRDPRRIFGAAALATGLTLWASLWTRSPAIVLVHFVVFTTGIGAVLILERLLVDLVTARLFPEKRVITSRALIVGLPQEREALAESALSGPSEVRVIGWVDSSPKPSPKAAGGLADFERVLADLKVEAVIVGDSVDTDRFTQLADVAMGAGCELLLVPRGLDIPGVRPQVVWRRGHPFLQLTAPGILGWQRLVKRMMDILGALLGLLILSPFLVLLAVMIKLDSRGPVFFLQGRVGQGGMRFHIMKFRTMVADAEKHRDSLTEQSVYTDPRLFKVREDPRITRVGRFLRPWSLDELPQLFNVLWGEMSLVGPRPPLPSEVELYEERHFARFEVKPGMTGPWQVSGRNEITDFEQVVALESEYIRTWSLFDDLVLLLKTVPAVLNRRGAY